MREVEAQARAPCGIQALCCSVLRPPAVRRTRVGVSGRTARPSTMRGFDFLGWHIVGAYIVPHAHAGFDVTYGRYGSYAAEREILTGTRLQLRM